MNKEIVQTEIKVNDSKINIIRIGNKEYISLTDLARYSNPKESKVLI